MTKCTIKDHLDRGLLEAEKLSDENHASATFFCLGDLSGF